MAVSDIEQRLRAAGITATDDPLTTWQALRAVEGPTVNIIDLYAIAAAPRGLTPQELPRDERDELARASLPVVWPGHATSPGSDRPFDGITISDPDPAWAQRYREWENRIRSVLGATARRVEHVGSTAVPGLAAKATVDIQVSVADPADEAGYVPGLQSLGLVLRSRDDYHRFFRPGAPRPRDVHVHVCRTGSGWEHDHLLFRDFLREHPAAREDYASVKRAAALTWADDRYAYTDAKDEVVRRIMERARRWEAG